MRFPAFVPGSFLPRGAHPAAIALAFLAFSCAGDGWGAADPTDTLQLYMTAGVLEDSNLFRQPDQASGLATIVGRTGSDTITRVGLGVKYDRTVSRQRVIAEMNLLQNDYRHNDFLDHVSGNAGATWLWQASNYWSGVVNFDLSRRLSGFGDLRFAVKNLVDQETLIAKGGYQMHPRWRAWGGITELKFENSSLLLRANDSTISMLLLGLDYRTPSENTVGGLMQRSKGAFPNREVVARTLVDNEYEETTTSLVLAWEPTGVSRVEGRLGYTERHHEQFPARDFDGPTFNIRYTWRPTGKLRVDNTIWRELYTAETETSNYVVSSGIRILPVWYATPNIQLRAGASYELRSYEGDPGVVIGGAPVREDTLRTFQVGATYLPHRNVQLNLQYEAGDRDSNQPAQDYRYNTILLNLRLLF